MSKKQYIKINKKKYHFVLGETILDICNREGIHIPTLCKHPDISIKGACRVCLVEVVGRGLVTSCSEEAEDGMEILTDTENVKRARGTNLEMIYASHIEKCTSCIRENNCMLKDYAKDYGLQIARYADRKKNHPVWHFGAKKEKEKREKEDKIRKDYPEKEIEFRLKQNELHTSGYIQFDASKCIDCGICSEVCRDNQAVDFYEVRNNSHKTITHPTDDKRKDCTYCGQCDIHCPVGAISGVSHWEAVDELIGQKAKHGKILVAQVAPSVRVSVGEEFGFDPGSVVTDKLPDAIKKMGFDYAFDVSTAADFTTYEEARELLHWIERGKDRPMLTSCCPGWVKFVEFMHPDFVPHLTTTRSPQVIGGMLAKSYLADKLGVDPMDIIMVSVMPCVAKKNEITLSTQRFDTAWCTQREGLEDHDIPAKCLVKRNEGGKLPQIPAVDYVLSVRELAYMLKRKKIDLQDVKKSEFDSPLGVHSGAAVIYGTSGGVMESALRTADAFLRVKKKTGSLEPILLGREYERYIKKLGKISNKRLEFKTVRSSEGLKEATVSVGGVKLRVAVVHGLKNADKLLKDLREKKVVYDYVEVMACPNGCIGGGGQPVPTTSKIRQKRLEALYKIDKSKDIRTAHSNIELLKVYRDYFRGDENFIEELLHCGYGDGKRRGGYTEISKPK